MRCILSKLGDVSVLERHVGLRLQHALTIQLSVTAVSKFVQTITEACLNFGLPISWCLSNAMRLGSHTYQPKGLASIGYVLRKTRSVDHDLSCTM